MFQLKFLTSSYITTNAGMGYPNKQSGENIPFLARLVSLADSLEAMTGIRPYRTSLTWEEAYGEIKKGAGTQFDPRLTTSFFVMDGKSRDSY